MKWPTIKSAPRGYDGPARPTELTILGEDNLLLARCELTGTTWRMRSDGSFENSDRLSASVRARGTIRVAYIGDRPNEIHLDVIGTKVDVTDTLAFRSGQIVMNIRWVDVQRRLSEDKRRLDPPDRDRA